MLGLRMSFRRHNDCEARSDSLSRLRDRHHEIGENSTYKRLERDDVDCPTRFRRCLSPDPQKLQLTGNGDSRDYSLEYGIDCNRHRQMWSRSPQFGLVKTKSQVNDGDSRRDSQYVGTIERHEERGLKPDYLLDNTRTTWETYFPDSKLKGFAQYRRMSEEFIRQPTNVLSNHDDRGGNYTLSKGSSEDLYFPEKVDKSSDVEYHGERDNQVTYSRDASYYSNIVPSTVNGEGFFHYKDIEGTSSTTLRPNFSSSYMSGVPSYEDEYSNDFDKVVGGLGSTSHGLNCQSSFSDLRGDSEIGHKYLGGFKGDINVSPVRHEGQGYLNTRNGREVDGLGYLSDECRRVGSEDQVDHKQGDFFRPGIRQTIGTHFNTREGGYRYLRCDAQEHSTMKRQMDSVYYPGVGKSKDASGISKEFKYLESPYSQHDPRTSRDHEVHEVLHSNIIYDHDISSSSLKSQYKFGRESDSTSHVECRRDLTSDLGFGRDAGSDYNAETVREFRSNVNGDPYRERRVLSMRPCISHQWELEAKEDLTYRRLNSKYLDDHQINRHNSQKIITSDTHDAYDRIEEWNEEDLDVQNPSRRLYDKNQPFQRKKRVFDRLVECEHINHRGVSSSNDYLQKHSGIHSRLGNGHGPLKGLPWFGGSVGHISKKKKPSEPDNVWIKAKVDIVRADTINNNEPINSKRVVTSNKKSEPPEDSEEFKKLLHKAFLSFSKKLNENPSEQKSYKEQERVGSLLCIVCGRSESKEFMDTKKLAIHAFTSKKDGLRAQHLGLHKAICVLLGWQCAVIPSDINLYIPEPLSEEEALAQKEDLILWPPVVIVHTTLASQDNEKFNIVDSVTGFLRGKGIEGNFKSSLGRTSNTVVLKYLGTFSNLQNAERVHKYFSNTNRGRDDFNRRVNNDDDKKRGSKEEDNSFYYGYIGISEDLNIIDIETMNKCMIKSKKEIQDLAVATIS